MRRADLTWRGGISIKEASLHQKREFRHNEEGLPPRCVEEKAFRHNKGRVTSKRPFRRGKEGYTLFAASKSTRHDEGSTLLAAASELPRYDEESVNLLAAPK